MKVILNDYIEHVGERGDSAEVKPGYARNFLIPKGLAYLDTPGNRRLYEQEQRKWEEMDLHRKSAAERVAVDMTGVELKFERRAGERDVLFGSVSIVDIARELAERGFDIERRRILLGHPIKELGTFEVGVQIHRDITIAIPVHVVRPGDQPVPTPTEDDEAILETVVGEEHVAAEAEAEAEAETEAEVEAKAKGEAVAARPAPEETTEES